MVHGIAISDFNIITGIAELRKDIEMFNPKLRLTILPRRVIPRENRIRKMHRSVILSFDNEEMRPGIFGIPHNFTNWLALLLQVDSLERPSFT
jgi:hypothetical protein